MKARAQKAIQKMGKQFLTPLEAANLLAGDKNDLLASPQGAAADEDDEVLFIDVRTPQQRADHEILPGGIKVQLNLHARFKPYGSRQAIPPKRKHAPRNQLRCAPRRLVPQGLTPLGSVNVPLDDMVAMPPAELRALLSASGGAGGAGRRGRRVLLTCTAGPKSCVAWDFLTGGGSVRETGRAGLGDKGRRGTQTRQTRTRSGRRAGREERGAARERRWTPEAATEQSR